MGCEFPFIFIGIEKFIQYAPLAHLVEHLTLNQGVRGSSPRWRTPLDGQTSRSALS